MRESQHAGRLRLRHLRESTEAVGEEMAQEAKRFQDLAREDRAPRAVSAFNLFQTPPEVAARMIEELGSVDGPILEPSAGLGRIYRAIREQYSNPVTLVEVASQCCAELYREIESDRAATLLQRDFLECDLGKFAGIVMNPPFKMGRDVKHIKHAINHLAPGGKLVALCFNGTRQNKQLRPLASSWEMLPAGSFKSEGTRADVVLMTYEVLR